MKANELRIGNLVNTPNPNMNPFMVESVENIGNGKVGGFNSMGSIVYWYCNDINPIPLTEQWLVRAGFVFEHGLFVIKTSNYETIKITLNKAIFHFENIHEFYYNKGNRDNVHRNIKHVHQLQNLFYALTGQELTIKTTEG